MQLKFFGEVFHERECKKTCDNCRAGKVPDRRDMTSEAKAIIDLFNCLSRQAGRKGGGITMNQLSELFRGSKAKSVTKNFNVDGLRGYGAGSKYKRYDIDRITHEMVFEKILNETSSESNVGFLVDYVSLGENAEALQNGTRKLFVEFPAKPAITSKTQKNSPKAKKGKAKPAKTTKKKPTGKTTSGTAKKQAAILPEKDEGGLQFEEEDSSDSDNDSAVEVLETRSKKRKPLQNTLPNHHTQALVDKLKRLIAIWAEAEQLTGNNVMCKFPTSSFLV